MTPISIAAAFEVEQSPAPDRALLERFEAERQSAETDMRQAEELRKKGAQKITQADEKQQQLEADTNAELCRMGALPASQCP